MAQRLADRVAPTWRGWLLAIASSFALWHWGYARLDLVVFVLAVCGLVLLLLSAFLVSGAAVYLGRVSINARGQRASLEAGSPLTTGYTLPALHRLPLVKVRWRWLTPSGVDCQQQLVDGQLIERVTAHRRCQASRIERRITIEGAFGLSRVAWRRVDPSPITVLPDVANLRSLPPLHSMSAAEGLPHPAGAAEGDRMDIRRYAPGDSARHIMWKTYARSGQLNVRLPERSIDRAERTVAYLLTGGDDEAAAAVARVALERGLLGERWLFGVDGEFEPLGDIGPALDAIARSGSPELPTPDARRGLDAFLDHTQIRDELHCVVFLAASDGPWLDDLLTVARQRRPSLSLVVATDGVDRRPARPRWHRWLFAEQTHSGTIDARRLDALLGRLSSSGHHVALVDRTASRYSPSRSIRSRPLPARRTARSLAPTRAGS